jgi:hypothetical protein
LEGSVVEFVWMRRDGIEKPARIPQSAVPHWEGRGWELTDPPPRPARPARSPKFAPAEPVESEKSAAPVDATTEDKADDAKSSAKTLKAPSGRKED